MLQSPTTDHPLARAALTGLHAGGHTAIGDAINTARERCSRTSEARTASGLRRRSCCCPTAHRPMVPNPIPAAQQAKAQHIPVYTVALGTAQRDDHRQARQRHADGAGAAQPAGARSRSRSALAGARSPSPTARQLSAVYAHLAAQLGHKTRQTRDHRGLCRRRAGAAAGRQRCCRCAGSAALSEGQE